MSRLARLLPSAAQPRRSYSIFSSRSGNGRYFNSAKPTKVITSTTKSGQSSSSGTNAKPEPIDKLAEDGQSPTQEQQITADSSQSYATPPTAVVNDSFNSMSSSSRPAVPMLDAPPHFSLKPNDLMLHRFFALHRPCLLLNQPTNALFEPVKTSSGSNVPPSPLGTIDDPPVASPEADSDAARQLSRSLVMSRVGNSVDWEHALARLGLGEAKMLDIPTSVNVSMDSVKRKRRRKMKKHKLKKRRRLTRAARQRSAK